MEGFSKRLADAIRAAGDDDDFSCNFHTDVLEGKGGEINWPGVRPAMRMPVQAVIASETKQSTFETERKLDC
ncbi:hypothetical protein QIG64_27890, partial [Klebsiella pneumoniae]|nr:hypothetical protein [Klebsiella pneumoniae]